MRLACTWPALPACAAPGSCLPGSACRACRAPRSLAISACTLSLPSLSPAHLPLPARQVVTERLNTAITAALTTLKLLQAGDNAAGGGYAPGKRFFCSLKEVRRQACPRVCEGAPPGGGRTGAGCKGRRVTAALKRGRRRYLRWLCRERPPQRPIACPPGPRPLPHCLSAGGQGGPRRQVPHRGPRCTHLARRAHQPRHIPPGGWTLDNAPQQLKGLLRRGARGAPPRPPPLHPTLLCCFGYVHLPLHPACPSPTPARSALGVRRRRIGRACSSPPLPRIYPPPPPPPAPAARPPPHPTPPHPTPPTHAPPLLAAHPACRRRVGRARHLCAVTPRHRPGVRGGPLCVHAGDRTGCGLPGQTNAACDKPSSLALRSPGSP